MILVELAWRILSLIFSSVIASRIQKRFTHRDAVIGNARKLHKVDAPVEYANPDKHYLLISCRAPNGSLISSFVGKAFCHVHEYTTGVMNNFDEEVKVLCQVRTVFGVS